MPLKSKGSYGTRLSARGGQQRKNAGGYKRSSSRSSGASRTGYKRSRASSKTKMTSTMEKRVKNIVSNSLKNQEVSKSSLVLMTLDYTPEGEDAFPFGSDSNVHLNSYSKLFSNSWMGWGHLLSNIRVGPPGSNCPLYKRGGDTIRMGSIEFTVTIEQAPDTRGSNYRFVVWKTNRQNDLTNKSLPDNPYTVGAITGLDVSRMTGGPPTMQVDALGPQLVVEGVNQDALDPSKYATIANGNPRQRFPLPFPSNFQQKDVMTDGDQLVQEIDTDRCTVMLDQMISLAPQTSQNTPYGANPTATPQSDPTKNIDRSTCRQVFKVPVNKKIEFSTQSGDLSTFVLSPNNIKDYINCAIVGVPNGNMAYEAMRAGQTVDSPMAHVRITAKFTWVDMNDNNPAMNPPGP